MDPNFYGRLWDETHEAWRSAKLLSARSCEVRFTSMSRHCQNDRLRPKSAQQETYKTR